MGKERRARQKFHQSPSSTYISTFNDVGNQSTGKSPLLKTPEEFTVIPDNLFEGIDINFDSLKKKIEEDDKVSVRSLAKSCKYDSQGKLLSKKEKMKLRHDLLLRKINTVQELKKEACQKHKKRRGLMKIPTPIVSQQFLLKTDSKSAEILNQMKPDEFSRKEKNVKIKGIKKSKVRQREMLQEISAFRKILSSPKFTEDPSTLVAESVQKKILKEMQRKGLPVVSIIDNKKGKKH